MTLKYVSEKTLLTAANSGYCSVGAAYKTIPSCTKTFCIKLSFASL